MEQSIGTSHTPFLSRERVSSALAEAVAAHSLTLLTAPVGYGKSTMAREVMARLPERSFYVQIPPVAHSAPYVWDLIWGQLARQGSDIAAAFQRMGFPDSPARLRGVFDLGREYTGANPRVLVLDDCHHITDPAMEALLEALAREAMPGLRLFLLSRSKPAMRLEDMRVKGLAALFGAKMLPFTRDEVAAYFALYGGADEATLESAWTFSEGWAAALWLAAQSWLAHGVIAAKRDMNTLLSHEVFSAYPPEDRRFLLQLSVLDTFTASQAAFLSDEANAAERLDRLYDHNAFLSFDPPSERYQLHSLFRAFLADKLAEDESIDKAALYRRAGESLLPDEDLLGAARFFHRAGRDADLLRLLELFTLPQGNMLLFLSAGQIVPLALSVPWRLRAMRPVAWLAFIYFYFAECDPLAALPLLEEAETRFAEDPAIPAPLKRRLQGEAVLIRSILAFNDLWAMREVYVAAHELLSGRSAISSRQMIWNFACPHSACLYLREPGSYAAMIELIEGNLHYFQDLSDGCSLGAELLFRAEYLLERGEFEQVEPLLQAAEMRARSKEQITVLVSSAFTRSRLLAATGKDEEAEAALAAIAPRIQALGHVDLVTCLDLAAGYLHSSLGAGIPAWLWEDVMPPSRSVLQAAGFIQVVRGKAALAAGDHTRLDALARALPGSQGPYANLFGLIHAKTQESIAARSLYGTDKALAALREALDLARPDGISLPIAEYRDHVLPLLRMLHRQKTSDAHLKTVIRLAEGFSCGKTGRARHRRPLSARQEEFLLLAAEGLNNENIAARLNVSAETVKKTLSAAYSKLGAKNRAEAVRLFMHKD